MPTGGSVCSDAVRRYLQDEDMPLRAHYELADQSCTCLPRKQDVARLQCSPCVLPSEALLSSRARPSCRPERGPLVIPSEVEGPGRGREARLVRCQMSRLHFAPLDMTRGDAARPVRSMRRSHVSCVTPSIRNPKSQIRNREGRRRTTASLYPWTMLHEFDEKNGSQDLLTSL
jgi:hypothetical protein